GNQDGGSQYKGSSEGGTSSGATSSGGTYGDGAPGDGSYSGDSDLNFGTCTNLASCQVTCADGGTTSLSGYVYDPAGKNPLYNVVVYIPTTPVKAITSGASCDQCGGEVTGNPLVTALTDATGHFVLNDVPVGVQLPLVMQLGKWRRQVTIPAAKACANTVLSDKTLTRLPATQAEGNIPLIAVTTGGADPLECLLRKVGIKDSEFTTAGGTGRVQLYAGGGVDAGGTFVQIPTSTFASTVNGGSAFASATPLWSSATNLEAYDIVLLACEGAQDPEDKPSGSFQAMDAFERAGGRVFMSHWQDIWIEDGPAPLPSTGVWTDWQAPPPSPTPGTLDTSFPKGQAFHDWLQNVGALDSSGQLDIYQSKGNLNTVGGGAQQWVSLANSASIYQDGSAPDPGVTAVQYMSFNTPLDVDASAQCGRVVYSDLHVSAGVKSDEGTGAVIGDQTGQPFPTGCVTTDLSPQEKALEFMLFDLSSCIQSDTMTPMPPM
ncbi:MAG: carboxypeptidase regulatory-like domain-containing protein, partial [Gemmatimonadales bacterium]